MIQLSHITVTFGEKRVLDDVSMQVPLEGVTALSGPSGVGKTTLLRVLRPFVAGYRDPVTGFCPATPRCCFQEAPVSLAYRPAAYDRRFAEERREEAGRWLALTELDGEENAYPSALSGGHGAQAGPGAHAGAGRAPLCPGRALCRGGRRLPQPCWTTSGPWEHRFCPSHEAEVLRQADHVLKLQSKS